MIKKNNYIGALDIGTSKICALIAEIDIETREPIIRGYSQIRSRGVSKSLVVNIDEATESIKTAVDEAREMSGVNLHNFYVSVTGDHIRGINTSGRIAVSNNIEDGYGQAREIEQDDIDKLFNQTMAFPLPIERDVLHLFPKEYIVDEQHGIKNPINLCGRRLEAEIHLATYSTTMASNISQCMRKAGLKIERFVLHSLASSLSVLDEEEKELGAIMLDIGAGSTGVIVYYNGNVYHTGVINHGSLSITNDIAYLLQIPMEKAKSLKEKYGWAKESLVDDDEVVKINGMAGRPEKDVSKILLAKYIKARMEEILQEAYIEANKTSIPAGKNPLLILTGGGAMLRGCVELADEIFNSSARIACPKNFQGFPNPLSNPSYAASIGLLKYAIQKMGKISPVRKPIKTSWYGKMKKFIEKVM